MFARLLFNILGTLFLLVGILGHSRALTPSDTLSPACLYMLRTGSQTLHRWLMRNTYVGTYITTIKEHRGMPLTAKIMTMAVLWAPLLFSLYRIDSWLLDATLLMVGIGVTALIVRLRTVGQS